VGLHRLDAGQRAAINSLLNRQCGMDPESFARIGLSRPLCAIARPAPHVSRMLCAADAVAVDDGLHNGAHGDFLRQRQRQYHAPMEGVHSIEADFLSRLAELDRDGRRAVAFVYTLGSFNHLVTSDPDLLDQINHHGLFWVNTMAAVQAAGFVALGRLYDSGGDVHHIDGLLDAAVLARGVFRRPVLEMRKLAAGVEPSAARKLAAGATEPGPADFDRIRREFNSHRQQYVARVQPIRHRVFAHNSRAARADLDTLFVNLPVRVLESVALFPLRLCDALRNTYDNGAPLVLRDAPSNVVEIVEAGPLPDGLNTWEHVDVVDAVVKFLRTLSGGRDSTLPVPSGQPEQATRILFPSS
jgi:hypothetical protein